MCTFYFKADYIIDPTYTKIEQRKNEVLISTILQSTILMAGILQFIQLLSNSLRGQ